MYQKHRWNGDVLSKDADHCPVSLLKCHFSAGVFHTFCYCKSATWFLHKWTLGPNGLKKLVQQILVIKI